jgi:hypothetical protein
LLFNHRAIALDDGDGGGLSALLPDLNVRTVQRLLGRTSYATVEEQEAELCASLLGSRSNNPSHQRPSGISGRLEMAMGIN